MWPNFWFEVPKTDSRLLRYEFEPENVYWKATYVNFCTCHKWIEGIMAKTMEPI